MFYCCNGSVARVYYGVIGHCQQFGADSVHKRQMVSVWEIGATVTALENDITRKYATLLLVPEYQTAW